MGKGSGLSLSMVHGVAVQSGGNVYIDSEMGKGTTVRIYLRRAVSTPVEMAAPREGGILLRGSAIILVVDDDPDVREVAVNGLREFGYDVLEAGNGHAALDLLATGKEVALVLIDVAMPGMNGAETIRRAWLRQPELRALFVTGYESAPGSETHGDDHLLRKPYRLETLAEAVRSVLEAPGSSNVVPLKAQQR